MTDLKKSDNSQDGSNGRNKTFVQIIWGVALVFAGTAVFFRIPQVMPRIEKIEQFSSAMVYIRFCFYLLGILLVGGGSKKIYDNYRKLDVKSSDT
ncbi:MAG: hypothetical protein ABUJ92_03405 [Desulfobacterales bacterium]